jgi:hypothetical protein
MDGFDSAVQCVTVLYWVCDPQMIARGKNASDLFPAVVKNVACKNIEVSLGASQPSHIYCSMKLRSHIHLFFTGVLVLLF